jgi:hypothetical protein
MRQGPETLTRADALEGAVVATTRGLQVLPLGERLVAGQDAEGALQLTSNPPLEGEFAPLL